MEQRLSINIANLFCIGILMFCMTEGFSQCANTDVSTIAGEGTSGFMDGPGATAQFSSPAGVAVDGAGNIIVADPNNHSIRSITPAGEVSTIAGDVTGGFMDGPGATALFSLPAGVAVDGAGNIIVADLSNHSIRKIGNCIQPQNVPTLGQWGLIVLSILLLILGTVSVRQKVYSFSS